MGCCALGGARIVPPLALLIGAVVLDVGAGASCSSLGRARAHGARLLPTSRFTPALICWTSPPSAMHWILPPLAPAEPWFSVVPVCMASPHRERWRELWEVDRWLTSNAGAYSASVCATSVFMPDSAAPAMPSYTLALATPSCATVWARSTTICAFLISVSTSKRVFSKMILDLAS